MKGSITAGLPLLLLLAGAMAPPTTEDGGERAFTLLIYNVAGLPEPISSSNPSENMIEISPLLNTYDVVLVQEDFFYHRDLVARIEHPYRSPDDCRGRTALGDRLGRLKDCPYSLGDGLNRFSNFPFSEFARERWEACNGYLDDASDCLTPKGFSFARHEFAPGVTIDIYNLHADAGNGDADAEARASNYAQLLDTIEEKSSGRAIIVAGDTNSRYRQEDLLPPFTEAAGLTDVWLELDGNSDEEVDKIFYRSSNDVLLSPIEYRVESERFVDDNGEPLSDHFPIMVRFSATF